MQIFSWYNLVKGSAFFLASIRANASSILGTDVATNTNYNSSGLSVLPEQYTGFTTKYPPTIKEIIKRAAHSSAPPYSLEDEMADINNDTMFYKLGGSDVIMLNINRGFDIKAFKKIAASPYLERVTLWGEVSYEKIKEILEVCEGTNVSTLSLFGANIDAETLIKFLKALGSTETNITKVRFNANAVDNHNAFEVGTNIAKTGLLEVHIPSDKIDAKGIELFLSGLEGGEVDILVLMNCNGGEYSITPDNLISPLKKTKISNLLIDGKHGPICLPKIIRDVLKNNEQKNTLNTTDSYDADSICAEQKAKNQAEPNPTNTDIADTNNNSSCSSNTERVEQILKYIITFLSGSLACASMLLVYTKCHDASPSSESLESSESLDTVCTGEVVHTSDYSV